MPTLLGEKRVGSTNATSSDGTVTISDTIEYLVEADYKGQSRGEILATPGLPLVNITSSNGGLSVCKSKDGTRREANPLYWDVRATFSSELQQRQDESDPDQSDPDTWIPIYETKFERLQEASTSDKDGDVYVNSADQPFENGLILSRFIPIWYFYQFEKPNVTDETVIGRNEVVNDGTFKGRAAKTLLCTVESSVIGFFFGRKLRLTYYSLKYNKDKWTHKRADVGTVYKSGSDLLPYTDSEGNVILGGLNGSGGKVAVGTAPSELEFDRFDEADFGTFLRI